MLMLRRVLLILALPLIGAGLMFAWREAGNAGLLTPWELVGQPPGPVTSLTVRSNGVWANLDDGTIYWAETWTTCTADCWHLTDAIPLVQPDESIVENCTQPI